LSDIAGVLQVTCDLVGRPDDPLALSEDEILESPLVAARGGPNQIGQVLVVPHPQAQVNPARTFRTRFWYGGRSDGV
jgi:hypothetical protein